MTRKAFENAIRCDDIGRKYQCGSAFDSNGKKCGCELTQDDFQSISDKSSVLADFKPSGKYLMQDLHQYGGVPAVMKYLWQKGLLHGDCLTVTGKTLQKI
jgi:dihydroxy-acid dehydratase